MPVTRSMPRTQLCINYILERHIYVHFNSCRIFNLVFIVPVCRYSPGTGSARGKRETGFITQACFPELQVSSLGTL